VVLVLVAALPLLAVLAGGWGYAAALSTAAANEGALAAALAPAGEIDRGFRLPAPSCSIDPGFHLRIPNIDRIDPGFGPVPSPPPTLPRCSGTPAHATPVLRP
jgi:hypothetical protein